MKTSKFLFVIMFFFTSFSVTLAQLTVDAVGRSRIGANFTNTFDDNNEVTAAIFGSQTNGSGGRLVFGNYRNGANNGMNVFIGEYNNGTNFDTDILQLQGKNAIYVTGYGTANSFIAKFHTPATHSYFSFETGNIVAPDIYLWSDTRLKKNIKPIGNSLESIQKLRGLTYDMLTDKEEKELAEINKIKPKDQKEAADVEKMKQAMRYRIDVKSKNHLGFVAQEIQAVFPQAVQADNDGILAVNYVTLIPVLLEGIKEQQAQIEAMKKEIELLKKK